MAGRRTTEIVYLITSGDTRAAPMELLATWVQSHWEIENRLHWVRELARLLDMTREPNVTVQVLPFDQGEHDVVGGSLTTLLLPDGTECPYTEGSHHGQLKTGHRF